MIALVNDIEIEYRQSESKLDLVRTADNAYHAIINNQSYQIEIDHIDVDKHQLSMIINHKKYKWKAKTDLDLLIRKLGLNATQSQKIKEIKAPMPGLVLDISIKQGQQISKGDALLILEAMKMENVIKAPCDGIIKSIEVNQGDAIEKNSILIILE